MCSAYSNDDWNKSLFLKNRKCDTFILLSNFDFVKFLNPRTKENLFLFKKNKVIDTAMNGYNK